jgi:hypothetical protein
MVTSMERSLAFYIDGLGFIIQNRWIPDGRLRWCWMSLGGAALMLQEVIAFTREKMAAEGILGKGAALYFQCSDALAIYHEAAARQIYALREPRSAISHGRSSSPTLTATRSTSPARPICPKKPFCLKSNRRHPNTEFVGSLLAQRVAKIF